MNCCVAPPTVVLAVGGITEIDVSVLPEEEDGEEFDETPPQPRLESMRESESEAAAIDATE